jgi:hypothetical protein
MSPFVREVIGNFVIAICGALAIALPLLPRPAPIQHLAMLTCGIVVLVLLVLYGRE